MELGFMLPLIFAKIEMEQLQPLLIAVAFVLVVLLVAFRSEVRKLVNWELTVVKQNESKLLEVTTAIAGEIQLEPLLQKVMASVTEILGADRSTLFLYDAKSQELWSTVADGLETKEIRFPCHLGIAGTVFTSGETINIKDAYSDARFNQAVDKKTGYRTRSILCMQITNKYGQAIGVVQTLNKSDGPFNHTDELRLKAFCSQAAIAIENAKLFEEVIAIKNYNEAMLESMSSGIISTDEEGEIYKSNAVAHRLLGLSKKDLLGHNVSEVFTMENYWITGAVKKALEKGTFDEALDTTIYLDKLMGKNVESIEDGPILSVNVRVQPLNNDEGKRIGCLIILDDITEEKRLRSTMSRYMSKELADKLLSEGGDSLGGTLQEATILFSDIRAFTTFSERNGPQETVKMLNEYFDVMYDVITGNEGILDKYIGDAIMAVFGAPFRGPNDVDNALQAAIGMTKTLRDFNAKRIEEGKERIDIGIGISTGDVVSGNIGSPKRMDYTVIGDGVNLAARLEGATKAYQTQILISEKSKMNLKGTFHLREVDRIRVKGKEEPVSIYESLDALPDNQLMSVLRCQPNFEEALSAYLDQQWEQSKKLFQDISEICPEDGILQIYIERCDYFRDNPPPENWDGVWTMKTK